MTLILTLIVLAQADGGIPLPVNDAGASYSAPLYETCPAAPPSLVLDGGFVLLPPERSARLACLMETCDADRTRREREMKEQPATAPAWWALLGASASSLVLGFTVAKLVTK